MAYAGDGEEVGLMRGRAGIIGVLLLSVGGCPLVSDAPGGQASGLARGPAAGSYFVDLLDGVPSYFAPAEIRGGSSRWIAIDGEASWYAGPGLYEYRPGSGWTPLNDPGVRSADDIAQVNDPPPAVP